VAEPQVTFAELLRRLRGEARLTQEELAEATGLSTRSVSDLERGVATTPHRDTVRLLADALHLTGQARAEFEAVARGRPVTSGAYADGAVGAAAVRTLPRDIGSFTGRQRELGQLAEAAAAAAGAGGVVGIHAIGGMAGVGKTAFAVHAAYRLADRFPGGQLFLPLHGHTPGRAPVDPADALASLLLTAGVPAAEIPAGLEARMALWRDRLAQRQLLLVLDDAASSEQVRPLLPSAGSSLVLVTSRRHLAALEDATAISLDTLPPDEAAALLVRLTGRPGLGASDPAVAELIGLCGFLPLAIGLVARQLHHHPAWSLAGHAAELAAARDRLELMAAENASVAAAFDLSYGDLAEDQRRLFRRLGLHPGSEFDAYAAAALDGTDLATARRALGALYDQYLLTEPSAGRYRMHDLIREHARALAGGEDPGGDRDQATARLLDYYQHTAALAHVLITHQARAVPGTVTTAPTAVPTLADLEQALGWARAERANLLACLDHATETGQYARIIALTAGLAGLLGIDGPWDEALARHAAALDAAEHLGDRTGQANALIGVGSARQATGDRPGAARAREEALGIFRDLGDRRGQADALVSVGAGRMSTGDYPGATRALREALDIFSDLGERHGQAEALTILAGVRQLAGDWLGSARDVAEALDFFRDAGDRYGQARALLHLGIIGMYTGDYPDAARHLEEAMGIYRDTGDRIAQAEALACLGEVRRRAGDHTAAAGNVRDALDLSRDLGIWGTQAIAHSVLAGVQRAAGDYPDAARHVEEALGIFRAIGDRGGEATALNESGTLHRVRGAADQAGSCHRQALDLARQIGSAWDEAHALAGLARCDVAAGRAAEAADGLRRAVEIFRRIGAAEAAEVSRELDALTGAASAT
jgi:tetratricopeptide (TPR) repeat protein/transcriptional regulator with XRE-family HTH domain